LAPLDLMHALISPGDSVAGEIVLRLRLPRALAAFSVGGLLALAGALMQVLLRNPLADPYVLGLSGGPTQYAPALPDEADQSHRSLFGRRSLYPSSGVIFLGRPLVRGFRQLHPYV